MEQYKLPKLDYRENREKKKRKYNLRDLWDHNKRSN